MRCPVKMSKLPEGFSPDEVKFIPDPPAAAAELDRATALANAIHENDAEVAAKIRKQAELGELAAQVRVVEGYYDLDTARWNGAQNKSEFEGCFLGTTTVQ